MARLDDPQRLVALRASGLLRRTSDERLRTICMTASALLPAARCMVNVLDADFEHHLASWPDVPPAPIAVRDTGCQMVILADDVVVIDNAIEDAEVCDMPWVRQSGFHSYLGVPIHYDGQTIGTFCALDFKPRKWTPRHILTMQELAAMAELSV